MIRAVLKLLMIVAASSAVTGCKLAVMVTSGGDVTSLSGTRDCAGGDVCEFQITDANFSESFTAVAKPGYEFDKWQKSSGFFCGDSTSPTCTVALSGNAVLDEAIIALFNMVYIMPTFNHVGIDTDGDGLRNELDEDDDNDGILDVDDLCPLDENLTCIPSVLANNREWTQPDLFTDLSWNDINTICPESNDGICIDGGMLNGHVMTGWTWAGVQDITDLFNFYIGHPSIGSAPYYYKEPIYSPSMDTMFDSGLRLTGQHPVFRYILVFSRDTSPADNSKAYLVEATDNFVYPDTPQPYDTWTSNQATEKWAAGHNLGALFYR